MLNYKPATATATQQHNFQHHIMPSATAITFICFIVLFEISLIDFVFSLDREYFFSLILRNENPSAMSRLLDYTKRYYIV